ncbi:MAG: hypothetical protein KC940_23660 [Candidatus Omnitrophica bacterium]|nr:hypothetical protein [Candidatus Omnitrophota bacterium]
MKTRTKIAIIPLLLLLLGGLLFYFLKPKTPKPPGPSYTIQEIPLDTSADSIHINNLGHVAYAIPRGFGRSIRLWKPDGSQKTIGEATEYLHINDLNDRDLIVGFRARRPKLGPMSLSSHAFVWSPSKEFVDLGLEGETGSWAVSVHEDGWIKGASRGDDGTQTDVIWNDAGVVQENLAKDLMDEMFITGWEVLANPEEFRRQEEVMRKKGWKLSLQGVTKTQAVGILIPPETFSDRISKTIRESKNPLIETLRRILNRAGFLKTDIARGFPFLWQDGHFFDLNDCIPQNSEWEKLQLPADVNDRRQIVGVGLKNGTKIFMLTPLEDERSDR